VIREFSALQMPILLIPANYYETTGTLDERDAKIVETNLDELLPRSFGPEHLDIPDNPDHAT
jgi:cytidine deaminase